MADTWVADLTHFLRDGRLHPALPGSARRLVEHLGAIVVAVTSVEPDEPLGVRCRRRPGHKPCPGVIEGFVDPESKEICWCCVTCGDNGFISNWENTMWDLSKADEQTRH